MAESWKEREYVRYANCWEDADLLLEAFSGEPGRNFCSICSAGDNSLALLALDPRQVVALDINPVQLYLTELKMAVIQNSGRQRTLEFLGIAFMEPNERLALFDELRPLLTPEAYSWWAAHPEMIRGGVNHCGRFEAYFHLFRKKVLPLMWGRKNALRLLDSKDLVSQRNFFLKKLKNRRWDFLFDRFFNRKLMARRGRDPAFFEYVEQEISSALKNRAEYAMTSLPAGSNPYLEYILTGNYRRALPFYLRSENYDIIKERLDRMVLFRGTLEEYYREYPQSMFSGYNLSDIFEYMGEREYLELRRVLLAHTGPAGRLVYWNMMVTRRPEYDERLLKEFSRRLFLKDKAFFYKDLIIEEA